MSADYPSTSPTVAFIFARGGSKGVPRKNVRMLAGKPLIAHAIAHAEAAGCIDRIIVSTEDEEIASVAREWGAEVPFVRPRELATDTAPEWLAWQHAIGEIKDIGTFICIPTTSPLRTPDNINACVQRFRRGDVDVAFCVTPAARNPYFNMVTLDGDGHAHLAMSSPEKIHNRQAAPEMYDISTVCYVASPAFIMSASDLFDGTVGIVEIPSQCALDIDTEHDLKIAAAIMG